jgi:hypothetical protein
MKPTGSSSRSKFRQPENEGGGRFIKAVVVIVFLLAAAVAVHEYRHRQAADAVAQEQTAKAAAEAAAAKQAQLEIDRRAEQRRTAAEGSPPPLYKCETAEGTKIQELPCEPSPSADAGTPSPAQEDALEATARAELRQQAVAEQRKVAEAAAEQYAKTYAASAAANAAANATASAPQPLDPGMQARLSCQAAKDYRDAELKRVGLNRTFDMIRRLDDIVFEACKTR